MFRVLTLGEQLATYGRIVDLKASNHLWEDIKEAGPAEGWRGDWYDRMFECKTQSMDAHSFSTGSQYRLLKVLNP